MITSQSKERKMQPKNFAFHAWGRTQTHSSYIENKPYMKWWLYYFYDSSDKNKTAIKGAFCFQGDLHYLPYMKMNACKPFKIFPSHAHARAALTES